MHSAYTTTKKRQSFQGQVGNEFNDNMGTSSRRSLQKLPIDWILVEAALFTPSPFLLILYIKRFKFPRYRPYLCFRKMAVISMKFVVSARKEITKLSPKIWKFDK